MYQTLLIDEASCTNFKKVFCIFSVALFKTFTFARRKTIIKLLSLVSYIRKTAEFPTLHQFFFLQYLKLRNKECSYYLNKEQYIKVIIRERERKKKNEFKCSNITKRLKCFSIRFMKAWKKCLEFLFLHAWIHDVKWNIIPV